MMTSKQFLSLTVAFLGALTAVKAQDTVTMNLKDCMRYAVEHSTKMRIQEANNRDAQIDRRDAILQAFTPSVDGSTYAYYNFGRSIDPETNIYTLTTSFHNGYSISAGITLFNGFQAVNNLKITKTAQLMGKSQTQQLEDQICLATMEAYCNVLYYTDLLKAVQAQVKTAETSLQLATRREELGQLGHAEVVQIQADLADRQYQLTTCQNHLNDALITLKDVLFWPVEEPLKIEDLKPEGDLLALSAESDVNALVSFAKANQPSVFLAESTMKNAQLNLKTARWQLLPRLSLYGGWSSSYFTYPGMDGYVPTPYWEQISHNRGEYVQLSLNIPIFDRLSAHSNIAKRKNAYERAKADYDQALKSVEAEVKRAVADRDGAAKAMQQAQTRAEAQNEAFALNGRRFEQGLISSIEYQTAANNYLNAVAEGLNARLQYFIRNCVVQYYKGVSYLEQDFNH